MKKTIAFIFLIHFYLCTFSQSESYFKNNGMFILDFGLSGNEYLNLNIDIVSKRFLYGFQYEFIRNSKIIGEDYTSTINWNQFPEDFVSRGK